MPVTNKIFESSYFGFTDLCKIGEELALKSIIDLSPHNYLPIRN